VGPGPLSRSTGALPVLPDYQGFGAGSGPFQGFGAGSGPFQGFGAGSGPFITGAAAIKVPLLVTPVFRPIAATKIKAGSSRTMCLRDIESLPSDKQREELYRKLQNRQEDTGVQPVTKRYTTPYPAFRQVFAQRTNEGVATGGRIEVLAVLVNGTTVLGKSLIRLRFCRVFAV
jgi:hypothetical protein